MGKVTRCICHERSFAQIQEFAEQMDINEVRDLQREDYCSNGCGFCIPYIELMFKTGETEFEVGAYYKRKKPA